MKRTISLILCLCTIFALSACSNNDPEPPIVVPNDGNHAIVTPSEQDTPIIQKPTDPVELDPEVAFSYKMAPVHKEFDESTGTTTLWLVVEMEGNGWSLTARTQSITNNKTGENLLELEPIDGEKGQVSIKSWSGCICKDTTDFAHLRGENIYGGTMQRTIRIQYRGQLEFNDITINSLAYYTSDDPNKFYKHDETVHELAINADISQITTRQEFIHYSNLIEVGGKYYIFEPSISIFNAGNDGRHHTEGFGMTCVNGTMQELLDYMLPGLGFSYGQDAGDTLMYTDAILPSTYPVRFESEEAKGIIEYGHLTFMLSNHSEDANAFKLFAENVMIRYTDESGNDMVFCH